MTIPIQGTLNDYGIEEIQLEDIADLDRLVAERFNLPLRPYSTDIRAALEIVIDNLENSEESYFSIFRSEEEAFPNTPFGVGFERKLWNYGKTAPLAICLGALFSLKGVEVVLADDE
ncbi:hypothetical protein NIES4074_12110 [Cylindrospermum sp. NIES-4074]|nr:hypothetical protein NIES4074_12110 [Cylindrospermum sp. NIES-4074]